MPPNALLEAIGRGLLRLGGWALALLTELTHRDRAMARVSIEKLYQLLIEHGDHALRAAIEGAVAANRLSVQGVRAKLPTSDRAREASAPGALASHPRGTSAAPSKPGVNRAAREGGAS